MTWLTDVAQSITNGNSSSAERERRRERSREWGQDEEQGGGWEEGRSEWGSGESSLCEIAAIATGPLSLQLAR